jgi:ribosome-associated toxin RatA of RatAB toxin-antitoxin module
MSAILRSKLQTAIERSIHKLVDEVAEHTYDFVNIYIRRNKIELDPNQLKVTLDIVKIAIKDGFLTKLDFFNANIQKALDDYTLEESPLDGKK